MFDWDLQTLISRMAQQRARQPGSGITQPWNRTSDEPEWSKFSPIANFTWREKIYFNC